MPAIAEKEVVKELETARNNLIAAMASEEKRKDNAIYNAVYFGKETAGYLKNIVLQMRTITERAKKLEESISRGKTREIPRERKPDTKEIRAINKERERLNLLAKQVISYLGEKYHTVMTQYFVRVSSKYRILLDAVKNVLNLPEIKQRLPKSAQEKNAKKIQKLEEEWRAYEILVDRAEKSSIEEADKLQKTTMLSIDYYENFANILEIFLHANEETFNAVGEIIQKQSKLRFTRGIKMADSLLEYVKA
ncbi:hypothetical protein KY346_05690 [Candidatus Woesearchaeota archaeon]|nr:hypothetical protein [Candidatus Woesearchaeota archaeon]